MRRPVGALDCGRKARVWSCELLPSPVASPGHGGLRAKVSAVLSLPPSCRVFPSFLYVSLWLTLLSTYSAPGIVSIFFDPHNNPMKVSAPILQTRNRAQGPEGPAQGAAAVSVSARTPQCGGRAFALPQLPWAPRATPRGSSCLEKGVLGDREGLHRGGALLSAGVCRPGPSPSFRAEPMSFPSPWSGGRRKRQAALREE